MSVEYRLSAPDATIECMRRTIVPPYLLLRLTRLDDPAMAPVVAAARRSLGIDAPFRAGREPGSVRRGEVPPPTPAQERVTTTPVKRAPNPHHLPVRTISDARQRERLPGTVVRREGDPATTDVAVNEGYEGFGATHALYHDVYGRASIDGADLPLDGTVHYGRAYDNAFWDGERMVFGDGDGMVFRRFTASLSVIGHELTHGVTQYSANLTYNRQPGALNESISDVFGALVEQHSLSQDVDEASWLIGVGLFTDEVQGNALRSMKAPGTAYDDDVLGKDPQPDSMDNYIDTTDDNGGVHLNSGIPNRAFYLAASVIGGNAWEGAGHVWYDTITTGKIRADSDFAQFGAATVTAAGVRFGTRSRERDAVAEAWATVGVMWDHRSARPARVTGPR